MNWSWLSFVVGVLVGWLLEWVIDFIFWRRKRRDQLGVISELRERLEEARGRQRELEQQAVRCAQNLESCRADLDACQADLAAQAPAKEMGTRAAVVPPPMDLGAEQERGPEEQIDPSEFSPEEATAAAIQAIVLPLDDSDAPHARAWASPWDDEPEADLTRAGAAVVVPLAADEPPPEKQDLTKIEGIGPKISGLLQEASILNFAMLAEAPVDRLREILAAAGSRYRLADPDSWPAQARLAADGKWDELKAWQDRLSGGREVDKSGTK